MQTARIVSEEIDKIQEGLQTALARIAAAANGKATQVKVIRSRRETRVVLIFKGGLEETEARLQKVYKSITGKGS